ncbi:AfsR/SARP family transcriptional regulator [Lentzea cavernae]|uniref:SARP family transcriptional regulator n=1 Tax=Lentzea cavernae TaxID=2020703 RepID=A0ABQ3MKQ4_9PSEU|nr:BTAD domain-containing putative transcriptional regulator [Lentzea cavernae]GHH37790.1 SARP family transcriptional regulator [Lentzea cavernae]
MRAEYRVLGPLEVLLDGEPVPVPGGRCHVLLATLLLRPNRLVPVDELVDHVWDGDPPTADRAHKTLQMVVRRLRVALGEADCVRTLPGGYQAVVDPEQLDLLRFRSLAASGDFGAASALWRGPVLGNVPSERLHRDDVPRLADERLAVLERRIDADLGHGLSGELVAELRSLVSEHPLRESFWRHLMLALYRSGCQAEALRAYEDVRGHLADELGVDPCPALRELHQRILRADVAHGTRPQVPRQLPGAAGNFVGRHEELGLLDEPAGVTVVHGVGGIGKTTLVLHWARAVRDEFPDGDLYVNLRGFDPDGQPVDPATAAETLLVGLGVDEVPAGAEARFALLRTTLAGRRVLLVLDNAAASRQVVPLLPGAPGVRVVVTSRNQLRSLVSRHGATSIGLRQLGFEHARSLLAAVLGEDRLDAEPEPARQIVHRCAGLPLALRVFAERVSRFPDTSLAEFVAELESARLDALSDFDDVDVRAVFSWSYRALDEESARMFRLLSVHPGADFDVSAAAALAGRSVSETHVLLERLVADGLVQTRWLGRYCLHDLLRAYAAELCGDDEAAALRLTEWYVHTLENATASQCGELRMRAGEVVSGVVPQEFSSSSDALSWRRQEWDNLKSLLFAALARDWQRPARLIAVHLHDYAVEQPARLAEAVEVLDAVAGSGPAREQVVVRLGLVSLHERAGRLDDALPACEEALRLASEAGEAHAEAAALIAMSGLHRELGRVDEAFSCVLRGLEIAAGVESLECAAHTAHALLLHASGRATEALAAIASAEELAVDVHLELQVRDLRAAVLVSLGRHAEAVPELQSLVKAVERLGDATRTADLLERLGTALLELDRRDEAAVARQRALRLLRGPGHGRADVVAELE